ncbi:ketopantoate reductase family protein [Oceanobacillus jordanicus]|uniref:2-dehydropantoate 2-reductase n=1 Tax=Oceanobacillus jordanicus TaxID=2867266 RepID=A0AAW5BC71_9BACI|nr:ketopantoate reductase family protein [Oceanobacillus jordanicus]MCG3421198.1 ketopantoate reductase family protein [Oceanobacillus jordanicus]
MRIAIMGAGSLGTIIGAYLSKRNETVELIDVNKEHVDALNYSGATITGTVTETIAVKAITPEQMEGTYDLVLLLTKQLYNGEVLSNLQPYLSEDSTILSLQNGVPEESLASILGKDKVVGGSVEFGATWVKPGVSELTTTVDAFKANAFQIGELDGTTTDRIQQIKEVLDLVGNTTISTNLVGTKWAKLLVNVAMSGLSTALGCTYGDVLNNKDAVTSAVMLADETLKVGIASGVEFEELAGFNLAIFKLEENKINLAQAIDFAKKAFGPQALLKASMLQDLEKQRKTEIDYINGVVSSKGKETDIDTPFNDLLVRLVKKAETEKVIPNFEENLSYFKELL